jgi:hypothetical protein
MNRRRSKTQPCEDGRHKYPICVVVIKLQKRDKTSLLKECYESRKRERINEDDSFMTH